MPAIRDRSVVRSSVTPSAKYCRPGSLLRLAKGSTTIDRRGATRGCEVAVGAAATAVTAGVGVDLVAGQSHHAITTMTSAAAAVTAIAATAVRLRRGAMIGTPAAGSSATASGR